MVSSKGTNSWVHSPTERQQVFRVLPPINMAPGRVFPSMRASLLGLLGLRTPLF